MLHVLPFSGKTLLMSRLNENNASPSKNTWRTSVAILLIIFLLLVAQCSGMFDDEQNDVSGNSRNSDQYNIVENADSTNASEASDPLYTVWDEEAAPQYWLLVGEAQIEHPDIEVGMTYGALDSQGRATWAALLADEVWFEDEQAEERETEQLPNPAGWPHNRVVDGIMPSGAEYHGYLWTRSHLVADSLGGDPIRENIIIGTRTQNAGEDDYQGGMLYVESRAYQWLSLHAKEGATLYYAAHPVYVGNEYIPRSVVVDLYGSDGSINERYIVYNAMKGVDIDYSE